MTITLRGTKGSELTHAELDGNFTDLAGQITNVENLYLSTIAASNTYLTLTSASSTYLTQSNASSTYLTQNNASTTYLTQTNASTTYISLATLQAEVAASADFADFQTRIDALESMIEVARESEHPRAYEVLAGLIKNTSDVNDKLMDLNKKQKDLLQKAEEESKQPQIGQQTNNVFLGSTADIQRLLQNGDDIVDVTPERNVSRES